MDIQHETISFKRTFLVPPSRVFQAYTNERERECWSSPDDESRFEILDSEVRTGGSENAQCGTAGNMMSMRVVYHHVEQDRLIVFTEELRSGDQMLTVALVTFKLAESQDGGTTLTLTDQVTSLVGKNVLGGHRSGYEQALTNLDTLLANV